MVSFCRLHNTKSDTVTLIFWDFIFVYFLIKVNKGRGWGETLVMWKREKEGSLRTVRRLFQKCWVMHSRRSLQTCSRTSACIQTFESALPCSAHEKAPPVISFGKKDEHFNANPLNMIFIQLCTTCLWIKNILLKRRGLSYGMGRKAGCTCLSLAAWTMVQ